MSKKDIPYIFNPNMTFPGYFARHYLLKGIAKHAAYMKGTMLDFGCGSKPYKSLFTVDKYVGLDFENPGHDHTNEQIDVYYDGKTIPFEDNSFDSVFTSEVFEHVFGLHDILPQLNRVMKKGAPIMITCPFTISEHEVPNDYARYSSYAMKYMMEKNGFEVIQQEKLGNSMEVFAQLWLAYLEIHITPHLKKVPLLGKGIEMLASVIVNSIAIVLSKILPKGKELYLNNLLVCVKR